MCLKYGRGKIVHRDGRRILWPFWRSSGAKQIESRGGVRRSGIFTLTGTHRASNAYSRICSSGAAQCTVVHERIGTQIERHRYAYALVAWAQVQAILNRKGIIRALAIFYCCFCNGINGMKEITVLPKSNPKVPSHSTRHYVRNHNVPHPLCEK